MKKHILKNTVLGTTHGHCVKLYPMILELIISLVFLSTLTCMCNIVINALMLQLKKIFYVKKCGQMNVFIRNKDVRYP